MSQAAASKLSKAAHGVHIGTCRGLTTGAYLCSCLAWPAGWFRSSLECRSCNCPSPHTVKPRRVVLVASPTCISYGVAGLNSCCLLGGVISFSQQLKSLHCNHARWPNRGSASIILTDLAALKRSQRSSCSYILPCT